MDALPYFLLSLLLIVAFVVPPWRRFERAQREAEEALNEARSSGRHEPNSIRPLIDLSACMGSGACITACPEQHVIKLINGQAALVEGANCIGHGVCVAACPVGAIRLAFGSEHRGVQIPELDPSFQSNVPGLYIAGELGGMGLLANAAEQGVQAAHAMMRELPPTPEHGYDLVVVGSGPAGLAAAITFKQAGHSFVLIDQSDVGGEVRHYPRKKLVLTRPFGLPGVPVLRKTELFKEEMEQYFLDAVDAHALHVRTPERLLGVSREPDGVLVASTDKAHLRASRVLLALGRMGTPRRLDVPGEDRSKVMYGMADAETFTYEQILVVGGGDTAVETAVALSEQPGNRVWLSYRRAQVTRPKRTNRERLDAAVANGAVSLVMSSQVQEIGLDRVVLEQDGERVVLPNDHVFVAIGGVLPTDLLAAAGVRVQTHYGSRVEHPEA
jgi:thioredoxin reductase/Pyruvate/2-oxoacid:ferredoxin oxidoreductase delta subunit